MQVYITNLRWSKDRRAFMEKQLSKIKIDYQFFDCVIGAELTDEEIASKYNVEAINKHNERALWFNKGIIGCTLTNQNIYKDIIDKDLDYALLLEDDTVLPQNLPDILRHIETFIQQGDVILLFCVAWTSLELKISSIPSPFSFNYCFPTNPNAITGGSAFVVTREAARRMLGANTPVHTTPDSWSFFYNRGCISRLICTYPFCVNTADFKSTMQLGSMNTVSKVIDKYKIFPFYQLLKFRRNIMKRNKQKVIVTE